MVRRGWGWLANGSVILSIVAAVLDISSIVSIPTWIWVTLLLIGSMAAGFLAFHNIVIERDGYKIQLDVQVSALPNMEICGSPYVDRRSIHSTYGTEGQYPLIGKPYFAHVKFRNNPRMPTDEAIAKHVVAEISFFDNEFGILLNSIYGRWADTDQPGTLSPFAPIRDLCQVDFEPNGLPRVLDIALKYPEHECCHAFNNDSCRSREWILPEFALQGDRFPIRIALRGANVAGKGWWFMLRNEGKHKGITIESIDPPALDDDLVKVVKREAMEGHTQADRGRQA